MPLIFILLVSQNTFKNLAISVMGLINSPRSRRELDGGNACCCAALEISARGEGDVKGDLGISLLDVQV